MTNQLSSLQHPLIKHFVKLRTESKYRYEHQALMLEGVKPIQEIPKEVKKLLYTPSFAHIAASFTCEKWEVTEAMIHKISGMVSPEGVIAEVLMPSFVPLNDQHRVLAFDGLSDPGNLGTLMRTALALGWDAIYFMPGTCDPFNEKTLRAARGAHFKISLVKVSEEEFLKWIKEHNVQSLVADIRGEVPEKIAFAPQRVLILGNEAHGASSKMRQSSLPVTIPMPGEMESLNVAIAGGILLYLFARSPTKEVSI